MIVDSSALLAVILHEPGSEEVRTKLGSDQPKGIGTPTLVETGIVLEARLKGDTEKQLTGLLRRYGIATVPFTDPHWFEALRAFRRFGKGRHPAALNLGDCFSYATARLAGLPLLFVGNDFPQTDIEAA